jgi:hypothetical protein
MICKTCGRDRPDGEFRLSYINKRKDGTELKVYRKSCGKCVSNFNMEHYPRKYTPAMGKLESTRKAIKKWFASHPDYHKNRRQNLVDDIIKMTLKRKGIVVTDPNFDLKLIELQRQQILLKRTIKRLSQNSNQ